ncbi:MAG TPA: hypothetical protein VMW56_29895 [Candidatus Margulisiibacteriota bacterium]|nr:hypothetical protein [Candidatus Margulisiibacteriota bacterium]
MKIVLFACAFLVVVTAGSAEARRRVGPPIHVRMVAYVNEPVQGTRPDFTWLVTYKGKRYTLYVLNLTVLNGRVTPLDINAAVNLYEVKFQIVGDKAALKHFVEAPPRQQVLMTGYVRLDPAARFLMLDTVTVGGGPTPAPTQWSGEGDR